MSTDVQEKTIEACAKAVHAASQRIWEEAESAAGHDAAERLKALNHPPESQAFAAEEARRAATRSRTPLVWEVFAQPGRMFGRWEMAPAFPDGRLGRAERDAAERSGSLIVYPTDTEEDIARHLGALQGAATQSV